ncbi:MULTISPECIES: thiol reductant ABC exporter subunit CydC [Exiguobacterium]|uniref:thiol reductant ABC exporter subunit CydC n=1 Tax=Exiguobacterium TaxID=33986 RepID=UPI0008778E7A|nr:MULTISPECIES: thiol reductant ABC exporter subunit CydC [Exiguobacterium]TCI24221.1 thiol reductant ABC exporter subunit CydC [Exiguobacterium sp. SH5S4]TCI48527.1 thiol reductant ABC exporter subunit CydC [Exiguobacterium sp. SH5S32]TCI55414.1 thiol reductant ABC exporter subunit CydC [Exiguobacterium sp. SH1S4]TCI64211.1 thiol reductant ABC exporter subunit CydC [Exiguobacterium sp. SH3S1]TCI75208.1 thiol reductant ABC exporter subunit CydC [Exiguobacterium sp. SH1S1]
MNSLWTITKWMMKEKKDIILSIFFGYTAGLAAVALFAASGYLVSRAGLVPPLYALMVPVVLIKLFGVIRAGSRYRERLASHRATFTILSELRVRFYRQLEPLVPNIFAKYRSGDLLARVVGDVESLQNYFLRVFYPPIILVLVFLSTIFFVTFFSMTVSLWLVFGVFVTGFLIPILFAGIRAKHDQEIRALRGDLSSGVTEMMYGYRDLLLHDQLGQTRDDLLARSDRYAAAQRQDVTNQFFNSSLVVAASLLVSWGVLAIGAYLVVDGELDGLFLAMLVMMSLTAFENVTPMAVFPGHYADSKQAANRLLEVVEPSDHLVAAEAARDDIALQTAPDISFERVSYRYPDTFRAVLDTVDVTLPRGSKTVIVGPSGSGKSTLLQLLLAFVRPETGEVRIDGQRLNEVTQTSVWSQASVVMQENHFFFGTVRDNLALAGDFSDDEMELALRSVRLGFALDEPMLEKGANLSGGERQRLAIARALLKNGLLWILDEATSALDARTESDVFAEIFRKADEATLVMVSHRLTGLERFDQIIVMEAGRIIESGSYDDLMRARGMFYELKQIEQDVFA